MKKNIENAVNTVQRGTSSLEELAAAYDHLHKNSEKSSANIQALDPNIRYRLISWPDIQILMDHEDFNKHAILCQEESVPSSTYFVPEFMVPHTQVELQSADSENINSHGLKKYFIHLCEVDQFTNEQVTLIRDYPQLWENSVYEYQRRKDRELSTYTKHLLLIPKV